MTSEIQVFNNPEFGKVRTFTDNEIVLFCGRDIAEALGYAVPHKAIWDHCKGVLKRNIPTAGGTQEMSFISESDVYRLVCNSKLPDAVRFEKWVFEEVLPSIRRHGAYMTPETIQKTLSDPDFIIGLATRLKEEQRKAALLEATVRDSEPKVLFADAVSVSQSEILIGDLAKILKQNGIDIGQKRLFERLRNEGFLMKSGMSWNLPTQKAMDLGLFRVQEKAISKPDGSVLLSRTTRVTGKGQLYFTNYFLKKAHCVAF